MKNGFDIKLALLLIFVLLFIMIVIGVFTFDSPDPRTTVELTGIVHGLYQGQSDVPQPTVFLVKLSDGNVVQVKGTSHVIFKKGRKVNVIEQKTTILKRRIYQFVGYVDEIQSKLPDDQK